ncbi:MAG: M14 family zinc carboxypeptidase, partial [Acidobacteriota bacterium]|nr:M14 family zinc carboxypeptidase [Acidobacteriota bacterium]
MTIIADVQSPKEFAELWDEFHITTKPASNVRHADIEKFVGKLASLGLTVEEVGRSYGNRGIYQIEWGKGETRVLMWSQMHGDEPTATSALIDMFAFLETRKNELEWVKALAESVTIRAVPMLNPDG